MVRTSRSTLGTTANAATSSSSSTTAAAVAAAAAANMDDIDLDVMFAEDGDELFEGLDIDYDMDDIGGGGGSGGGGGGSSSAISPPSTAMTTAMNTTSSISHHTNQRRGVLSRPPPSSPDNDDSIEEDFTTNSRTRRKTKRKTKAPSFFADDDDDDDDDYNETVQPSTKNKRRKAGPNTSNTSASRINTASTAASVAALMKKKTTTTTTNIKGGQQHQQQMKTDDSSTISTTATKPTAPTTSKSKSKSIKTSNGMPPPLARNGPWVPTTSNGSAANNNNNNNNNKSNNNNNTTTVAHSGKFGNRQKRPGGTSVPALPKSAISSSSLSSITTTTTSTAINASSSNQSGGRVINKLPLARSASESSMGKNKSSSSQQQQQQKLSRLILQPENTYCGLPPSSTHFYPFMPSLPSEPALKSRKVYGTIDRIHTSLVGYIHTPPTTITSGRIVAKESDPIFQLLQEAFKEEKAAGNHTERLDSIGIAIAELRHSISTMDKNRIITDWYGVCALVQRQHDFLKQNCDNMERWCRDHFSKEDFDDAFVPLSKKRKDADNNNNNNTNTVPAASVLKTFQRREIKVRISFTGLKDPKNPVLIPAMFPQLFLTNEIPPMVEKEVKPIPATKKKSQTTTDIANGPDGRGTELQSPNATKIKPSQQQPLSYVNMKPPRRRRNVAEMITRTARELAKSQTQRMEVFKKNSDRRESDLQKLFRQDMMNGIHTAEMWKYLEISGYFHEITESEISDRLGDLRSFQLSGDDKNRMKQKIEEQQSYLDLSFLGDYAIDNIVTNSTVFDRLQSLLVDVDDGDDDDDDDDFDNNKDYLDKANTSMHELFQAEDVIDIAQLTVDERSLIQLSCLGVISNPSINTINGDSTTKNTLYKHALRDTDANHQLNGSKPNRMLKGHDIDEIDDIISAMKSELQQVETLNDERLAFLETVSNNYRLSKKDDHQRSEREASLIAKCQQLIRKTKDLKAKSGATVRKDDSLALPW